MSAPAIFDILKRLLKVEEKTEDTGWIDVNLSENENFKPYTDSSGLKYRKIGNLVNIVGVLSAKNNDNELNTQKSTILTTLASELRPKLNVTTVHQGSGTNIFISTVSTDGNISLSRYRNGSQYSSTPPDSGAWLPLNIVYYVR